MLYCLLSLAFPKIINPVSFSPFQKDKSSDRNWWFQREDEVLFLFFSWNMLLLLMQNFLYPLALLFFSQLRIPHSTLSHFFVLDIQYKFIHQIVLIVFRNIAIWYQAPHFHSLAFLLQFDVLFDFCLFWCLILNMIFILFWNYNTVILLLPTDDGTKGT